MKFCKGERLLRKDRVEVGSPSSDPSATAVSTSADSVLRWRGNLTTITDLPFKINTIILMRAQGLTGKEVL